MKKELVEALRLTREGRLAEAKALLDRAVRGGDLSEQGESHPEQPRTQSEQTATPPHIPPPRLQPFTPSSLKGMGDHAKELLAKLAARSPAQGSIPLAHIAPQSGRWLSGTFTSEAGACAYKLYLPSRYQGQALPLIVMLHGCTQNPDDFAAGTRMNFLAESEGFLVAYPEQAATANTSKCWNWFQPGHQQRDRGEPSLLAGVTRTIVKEYNVDGTHLYVAGLSAGGAMAAIMAATYPDLFAAVGVHSGLAPGSAHDLTSALQAMKQGPAGKSLPAPFTTIPLILFQGDHDSTVHPSNAEQFITQWIRSPSHVATRQGQAPGGRTYTCEVYADSSGQSVVERWTLHGANHAWSGGSSNGTFTDPAGPDASKEMLRFFQQHSR